MRDRGSRNADVAQGAGRLSHRRGPEGATDALTAERERDRSFVLEQAIEAYLKVRPWQRTHIEEGLRRADAGDFATAEDMQQVRVRWRR